MAGHSKWSNIKHRKGAQDAKRAKVFNKMAREIEVAAKSGPDPDDNPRLRGAISAARAQNMPGDRIKRAILKGSGTGADATNYEEIRYEGYATGGIALIVEALTDNRNRTASDVRSAFTKHGGALGETGSVSFMFNRMGLIEYSADVADADAVFEAALEAGADNVESNDDGHEITCDAGSLNEVRDALAKSFGDAEMARLSWQPNERIAIDDEDKAAKLMKLIDVLEDSDDVQSVEGNFDISDEILEKIAA